MSYDFEDDFVIDDQELYELDVEMFDETDDDDYYDDSLDGDFDTGMASAGWGTDEDYGFFDDRSDY